MTILLLCVFGLLVGSFLTVLTSHPDIFTSLQRKRSVCEKCGHILSFWDLVPLGSFLFLRGRCRYCNALIGWQHLAIEAGTVALFLLCFLSGLRGQNLLFGCAVLSILFTLTIFDLRFWILPDILTGFLALATLAWYAIFRTSFLFPALEGGILGLFLLGVLAVGSGGKAMGWGDVKFAGAMGLLLGPIPLLFALFTAFLLGAIVGVYLLLQKKVALKSHLPFGPFLTLSTALFFLFPTISSSILFFLGFG